MNFWKKLTHEERKVRIDKALHDNVNFSKDASSCESALFSQFVRKRQHKLLAISQNRGGMAISFLKSARLRGGSAGRAGNGDFCKMNLGGAVGPAYGFRETHDTEP